MTHTFLLQPGNWNLQGLWCERKQKPIPIQGEVVLSWHQNNWFSWNSQLKFANNDDSASASKLLATSELNLTYRGYIGFQESQYTFVLKHNVLGNLEGHGWITPNAIIQRYWVLNDRQRRQGFETFYQNADDTYYLCSCLTKGHQMIITLEATLLRGAQS